MAKRHTSGSVRIREKRARMRREILLVARAILLDEGADAVTLAAVASHLGITKQALYHYFASKEALTRGLVAELIDEEVTALAGAIGQDDSGENLLGVMIRAFHAHYRERLHAFRFIYGQSQLYTHPRFGFDANTISDKITPRTRHLFDLLESRLAGGSTDNARQRHIRRLAFVAWTSVLGLMTMIGIADATGDPLVHPDGALLDTLCTVLDDAANNIRRAGLDSG